MTTPILIFTKPGCPYCAKAKHILEEAGLAFEEIDVKATDANAALSAYLSGRAMVPQIFIGGVHVNGSTDLAALAEHGRLGGLVAAAGPGPVLDGGDPDEIAQGAEDFPLRKVIPEIDGAHSRDPDDWPILRLYKEFFGFWPNCFKYQYHWPEVAYRQFVYCHNGGAIGGGKKVVGMPVMLALAYATSAAQGCDYCKIHSASVGGEDSAGYTGQIRAAMAGDPGTDNPFGPFEVALADLVARATTNTVTEADLQAVRDHRRAAQFTHLPAGANIEAAAMIAAAFGFLNVFNDLTGVQVEGAWAESAEKNAGLGAGRHGASAVAATSNLGYDIPQGGPSMEHMLAHYAKDAVLAGGPARYTRKKLGLAPNWVEAWPFPLRPLHARFYVGVMTDDDAGEVRIAPELKHLMARVSAIAKGHEYLAAVEGWMAWHAAGRTDRAVQRVAHCFEAATDVAGEGGDLFDAREAAALRLAWLSAQTPLITPHRHVAAAIAHYTPTEMIHLITVCAMASLVQRFTAIARPETEAEVAAWLVEHGLERDTLALRYPLGAGAVALTRAS